MGFARQVVFTYSVRVLLIPLGAVNAAIVARWLGPADLGVYAAIVTYLATAAVVGGLGLAQAVGRSAAARPELTRPLVANARLTGASAGFVAVVALVGLRLGLPDAFRGISTTLLLIAGFALPLNLISSQLQAVLLARRRIRSYNILEGLDRVLFLTGSVVLLVVCGYGVGALVAAATAFAFVKLVLFHVFIGPETEQWRPNLRVLRDLGSVPMRAYLASLFSFLVLRSDLMLIHGLLGPSSTGLYSVAVRFADFFLLLPAAVGTLLFPRVAASSGSGGAEFTAAVCRHTVLPVTFGCLSAAATAAWIVPAIFGEPYQGAALPLSILLPGVWCMSLQTLLANDLAGRDYPVFLPWMWFVLLVVNLGLNLLWLPSLGIAGAALSSTIAYALCLVLVARYWLRRFPTIRARSLLVLEPGELSALVARLRARPPRST